MGQREQERRREKNARPVKASDLGTVASACELGVKVTKGHCSRSPVHLCSAYRRSRLVGLEYSCFSLKN